MGSDFAVLPTLPFMAVQKVAKQLVFYFISYKVA